MDFSRKEYGLSDLLEAGLAVLQEPSLTVLLVLPSFQARLKISSDNNCTFSRLGPLGFLESSWLHFINVSFKTGSSQEHDVDTSISGENPPTPGTNPIVAGKAFGGLILREYMWHMYSHLHSDRTRCLRIFGPSTDTSFLGGGGGD